MEEQTPKTPATTIKPININPWTIIRLEWIRWQHQLRRRSDHLTSRKTTWWACNLMRKSALKWREKSWPNLNSLPVLTTLSRALSMLSLAISDLSGWRNTLKSTKAPFPVCSAKVYSHLTLSTRSAKSARNHVATSASLIGQRQRLQWTMPFRVCVTPRIVRYARSLSGRCLWLYWCLSNLAVRSKIARSRWHMQTFTGGMIASIGIWGHLFTAKKVATV